MNETKLHCPCGFGLSKNIVVYPGSSIPRCPNCQRPVDLSLYNERVERETRVVATCYDLKNLGDLSA
jgi:hypothetical protein